MGEKREKQSLDRDQEWKAKEKKLVGAAMEAFKHILMFFFAFAVLTPTSKTNIADFDEFWQKRAQVAEKAARDAYQPNPEEVTAHFNMEVHKYVNQHLFRHVLIYILI